MIEDLSHLIHEIKPFYHILKHLRKNHGEVEFGLDTTYGIEWFSFHRLPPEAEAQIIRLQKLGAL